MFIRKPLNFFEGIVHRNSEKTVAATFTELLYIRLAVETKT